MCNKAMNSQWFFSTAILIDEVDFFAFKPYVSLFYEDFNHIEL